MSITIGGARLRRLALTTTIAIAGLTSAAGAAHAGGHERRPRALP